MKRKRAHDEKLIVKHARKYQPVADSDDDDQKETLEVRRVHLVDTRIDKVRFFFQVDDLTITVQAPGGSNAIDDESPRKKKKKNRREVDKEFFIPYQPPDFKRERGYGGTSRLPWNMHFIRCQVGNSILRTSNDRSRDGFNQ